MSKHENVKSIGELRCYKTRPLPKNRPGFFGTYKTILHDDLDKNCLHKFSDTLVRIEYPGRVKNIDKALDTLGGLHEIHMAIEGRKLDLSFNPTNQYSKGCVADKDQNAGILIKVIQHSITGEYSYEILGVTGLNFKFNKLCDFQYLPLVAKSEPENEESDVEYLHDKIIINKIPSLEWFTKMETNNHPIFLVSANFARFDMPQAKFQLNSADTFVSMLRPDILRSEYTNTQSNKRSSNLIPSVRVSFTKPGMKIPDQPYLNAMKFVHEKILHKHYLMVKNYFQERPVWRKAAIMHKTNISHDAAKYVLPCVAYYCNSGPWRACWIRFGYDPTSDYNSRIYQILDFRIRSNEGMQLKIKAKRGMLSYFMNGVLNSRSVSERDYLIRPNLVPPARQMFYQYCDILIPEIQEMVSKLPKLPPAAKYDSKNGWLPLSFQEHCREIVNKHIFDAVQQEVLKENEKQRADNRTETNTENISSYCSKMLHNIKKGIHQSIGEYSGGTTINQENIIDEIALSDDDEDDDELEQIDANKVVNCLPERIPENFEDDDESDLEIDMEVVEEVNEIVSGVNDNNLLL